MSSRSPSASPPETDLEYLTGRGFTQATIVSFGWRITTLNGDAGRYGLPPGTPVWVIPYAERPGRPAFERVRVLDEETTAYTRGKYRQPAGQPLDLYDPRGWLEPTVCEPPEYLLLIEGEANAAAIAQMYPAVPVVGLPGQRALKEELAQRLAGIDVVYVWLDQGTGFEESAASAAERLRAAGVGEVRFCDPGGRDANELLVALGQASGRAAVDAILNAARPSIDDGAVLLDTIAGFVRRYVAIGDAEAVAVALWVAHTHVLDAAETTPYLAITSAEKRSGKSRLLEIMELVVPEPLMALSISEAALFRSIDREKPTLLFDEVDAIFGPKARDREDLRAMLNAGHRRGGCVPRCVGSNHDVKRFSVFCAKAFAGIGELPDTVADRCLPIRLRRRAPHERPVERMLRRDLVPEGESLKATLERWGADSIGSLTEARPSLPSELDDRAQDAVEPLLAIADLVGGSWPERARAAVIALRGGGVADAESFGIMLLRDIRAAFDCDGSDRLASEVLLSRLVGDPEAPWSDWRGKPLTARGLATLLKPYRISSGTIRLESGATPKGYYRSKFSDAWVRYLGENAGIAT